MFKNKLIIFGLIASFLILNLFFIRFFIGGSEDTWICDKNTGSWVKHGNPSASKPTQGCGEDKINITPTIADTICASANGEEMTYEKANEIALEKCKNGKLKETYFCNPNSGTWWFDFTPDDPREGCNPACVIFVETGSVEINWRCTGIVEPNI